MNILDRGYGIAKIEDIPDKTIFRTESLPDTELSTYRYFQDFKMIPKQKDPNSIAWDNKSNIFTVYFASGTKKAIYT